MKNSVELKIKAKHLALEPAIIRKEEQKLKKQAKHLRERQENDSKVMDKFFSLQSHRREDVRNEARATHLARAYLAGKLYGDVEAKRNPSKEGGFQFIVLKRVVSMVNKYKEKGRPEITLNMIQKWANALVV